jgi:hypothetical protein
MKTLNGDPIVFDEVIDGVPLTNDTFCPANFERLCQELESLKNRVAYLEMKLATTSGDETTE